MEASSRPRSLRSCGRQGRTQALPGRLRLRRLGRRRSGRGGDVIRDLKFNLWDTEVGRYLGQFNDEKEALHLVRILVSHYGNEYADDLSLGCEAADGTFGEPLSGTNLLARAEAVLGDWAPESERRG